MQAQVRAEWLARLERLVEPGSDGWVPVEAELVRELARQGKGADVHARAERLRPHADEVSRARLLMAESLVDLLHHEEEAVASSYDMLHEATALLRVNGEREWEADAWLSLGFGADYRAGRVGLAVEHIERALALSASGTQMRGRVLTFLAEVLSVAGRPDEAEAALREVAELAAARADAALTAYTAWSAAIVASRRADLAAHPRAARGGRGATGASGTGSRPGSPSTPRRPRCWPLSGSTTRRARSCGSATPTRRRGDFDTAFEMAELVLAARDGDPAAVPELAERCARTPLTTGGSGSSRPGRPSAPVTRTGRRRSPPTRLGAAAALGHPEIVEAVEPELALWARALVGRAAATPAGATRRRVRLCGEVAVEGPQGVRVPRRGDETTLLAAVAARQDVDSDEVLELLWPGQPESVSPPPAPQHPQPAPWLGRRGRRTPRRPAGPRAGRRGRRARRAPGGRGPAHGARARRRGGPPRARGGRRRTRRVGPTRSSTTCVTSSPWPSARSPTGSPMPPPRSVSCGEAARYLTQARRLDRYDETRAARLVRVLRALGRDAEADEVLADALRACAELGVPPSPELAALSG